MIIHDFECRDCGDISEVFMTHNFNTGVCPVCGGQTKKIVAISQTTPVDPAWIGSVLEVVEKDSGKPHCEEFLKHPNRANYNTWMRVEGLRPLEPGEKPIRNTKRKDNRDQMLKMYRERNAISI